MYPVKFLLISPREPSGATWLINCLLELGIKTYRRQDPDWMWLRQDDGTFILNPEERILKKWLPVLSRKSSFVFRHDIEVQWSHEWPVSDYTDLPVIYFVRDPRDAIYSRFKREAPKVSFWEFIQVPSPDTLLNKIDNWILFNLCWLKHCRINVFKFEDYKTDAAKTLKGVLSFVDFSPPEGLFLSALSESSSDKARAAELEYKKRNKSDNQLINRAGAPAEWKKVLNGPDKMTMLEVEKRTNLLLSRFGYESNQLNQYSPDPAVHPGLDVLPFYSQLDEDAKSTFREYENAVSSTKYLSEFVSKLNKRTMDSYELLSFERELLLSNLALLFKSAGENRLYEKVRGLMSVSDNAPSGALNVLRQLIPPAFKNLIKGRSR